MDVSISQITLNGVTKYIVRGHTDVFCLSYNESLAYAVETARNLSASLRMPIGIDDRVTNATSFVSEWHKQVDMEA